MERLSSSAILMAIILHTVIGISYYFLLGRCSPAPLLGSWLFIASIGAALQVVHVFPQWCQHSSPLRRLSLEMGMCCLTLDLLLTKLWCRIETLCHCAIVGILRQFITEECIFARYEYWLLGLTTSIIGACLLRLTLWVTGLPNQLRLDYANWKTSLSRSIKKNIHMLTFGPDNLQLKTPRCLLTAPSFAS